MNTVERLALEAGQGLEQLRGVLASQDATLEFVRSELGFDAPAALGALGTDVEAVDSVIQALDALADARAADEPDDAQIAARTAELLAAVAVASGSIAQAGSRAAQGLDPAFVTATDFAEQLPRRLLDWLVVQRFEETRPIALEALRALAILVMEPVEADPATFTTEHVHRAVELDQLVALVTDPKRWLATAYGWGTDRPSLDPLLERLFLLAVALQIPAELRGVDLQRAEALAGADAIDPQRPGAPVELRLPLVRSHIATALVETGLALVVLPPHDQAAEGLALLPFADGALAAEMPLDLLGNWVLDASGSLDLQAGFGIVARPREGLRLVTDLNGAGAGASGSYEVRVARQTSADPVGVIAFGGDSGLFATGFEVRAAAALDAAKPAELLIEAGVKQATLRVQTDESDGFLRSVLPDFALTFDAGLGFSTLHGTYLVGGAGLRLSRGIAQRAGPVELRAIALELRPSAEGVAALVGVDAVLQLGPVTTVVQGIGARVEVRAAVGGNLGPVDVDLGLKPPDGIGLALEAGVVRGGGFVGRDPSTGRYAGELDLRAGSVDIGAVGLIETLPGHAGYSLLVVLRATFPAIEIGFGFALVGVGGLVGLNRRVDVDALRARLASGTADRILAPQDPIRNAPALVADLEAVFPVAVGVTVVGPTAQLTWAELVHLDIGVFIELPGPSRVVLLGSAHAEIARDGRTYLSIRVDILGVIDLRAETAAFDAALVDSHLMGMLDLTGGAAFRLSWGAQPYAVLSMGGFHPSYNPAPLSFPASLTRIAMVHGKPSDEVYLRFEGYFAITSNTLQFGASVEAAINSGGWAIHGSLAFDALIQRVPYHFTFDIRASVSVSYHGHDLASLTLTGSLSGPGPVVLRAKVCIELLFFDVCFSHTFELGASTPPPLPAAPDLLEALQSELTDPSRLGAAGAPDPFVRLAPVDPQLTTPVVVPTGTLVWEQRRAPLDLLLTRVGGTPLPAPAQVHASSATSSDATSDWFAPGQFLDLSDDQALTRPGYELLGSGLRLAGGGSNSDGPSAQATLTTRQIRLPAAAQVTRPPLAFPGWILTSARPAATPAIAVHVESWLLSTPAGEQTNLTGAQARQLAAASANARAIPESDRLAALSF
jgi:uncharacterized protein DUF6603